MLRVTPELQIALSEIEFTYARSSGPGGQNVNKVNSKAVLRWQVLESESLGRARDVGVRARILAKLGPTLNSEGELILTSDRFRDQIRNREDCLDKLREILMQAAVRPKPRKETRPTKSSKRKTVENKRRQSEKKSMRRSTRYQD